MKLHNARIIVFTRSMGARQSNPLLDVMPCSDVVRLIEAYAAPVCASAQPRDGRPHNTFGLVCNECKEPMCGPCALEQRCEVTRISGLHYLCKTCVSRRGPCNACRVNAVEICMACQTELGQHGMCLLCEYRLNIMFEGILCDARRRRDLRDKIRGLTGSVVAF